MTKTSRQPEVPPPREISIRQAIINYLVEKKRGSARDISAAVGLPDKSVATHLAHLQKTLKAQGRTLEITPACCLDCGFSFRKRERLSRPGKCPICRSTHLSDPRFSIK